EDLGMQHSRQPHCVRVLGAASYLFAAFKPRYRSADLRTGFCFSCHYCAPPLSAARTARPTQTRKISRLYEAEPRISARMSASSTAASPARASSLSSTRCPVSTFSAAPSRIALVVAALATTRADFKLLLSPSNTTATPSAGQSSADPAVTFM